jgi:hypothetical protein
MTVLYDYDRHSTSTGGTPWLSNTERESEHDRPWGLPNALTEGFQKALLGGAVIAALGVVATLVLIRTR